MISRFHVLCCTVLFASAPVAASDLHDRAALEALAAQHAKANGVPVGLVHRVILRESRYNPRAVSKGNYGLMQIRHATARGMGHAGSATDLLDPHVNLAYAVPYLANAYRVAGSNHDRAVALYSRGYYHEAKRKGLLGSLRRGGQVPEPQVTAESAQPPSPLATLISTIFAPHSQDQPDSVASATNSIAASERPTHRQRVARRKGARSCCT